MQWMVISLLVLAICELPVLQAKKVVVVMPRQVRRTLSSPWRHMMMKMHAKKNGYPENVYPGQRQVLQQGAQFYRPKDLHFARDQYPQGGDDFDQGHDEVNNVIVPHGKGITHALSFGKGYIPFEKYNDHRASTSHHHDYKLDVPTAQSINHGPIMNIPAGQHYAQAYITQQAVSHLENVDSRQDELQDRSQERGQQKYINVKQHYEPSNAQAIGSHYGVVQGVQRFPGKTSVYLSPGQSPTTLAGNKRTIVIRDSVVLDDYHRKVAELTKNWPSSFSPTNFIPGTIGPGNSHQGSLQQNQVSRQFKGNNVGFLSTLNKGQQGYAVKEDVLDTPHDFRKMPIQTAPIQTHQQPLQQFAQQPVQQISQQPHPIQQIIQQQQPLQQIIQQPIQQTLQHIFPQSHAPGNFPLTNYQGYVHG